MMQIYIPSRGRWSQDVLLGGTLKYLERPVRAKVIFVLHRDEREKYVSVLKNAGVAHTLSFDYATIDQKRLLIGKHAQESGHKKFLMLDDDLSFLTRRSEDARTQRMSTLSEVTEALSLG